MDKQLIKKIEKLPKDTLEIILLNIKQELENENKLTDLIIKKTKEGYSIGYFWSE